MKLNVIEYNLWYKNRCPNFTGVKENGNRLQMLLDSESWDELGIYGENLTLNAFENGNIIVYKNEYNHRNEEWVEKEIPISEELKQQIKEELDLKRYFLWK